jgi:hypothetical protein
LGRGRVGWTAPLPPTKSWATRHQARPAAGCQDPQTAASEMHHMGTRRGAALGGRCWKQKARCRPAGWIDCGPMASVLETLRNRPPGRKQLTGAHQPSAARLRVEGHTHTQIGAAWRCTRAAARRSPTSAFLLLPRSLQPVCLCLCLSASDCCAPVEHLSSICRASVTAAVPGALC